MKNGTLIVNRALNRDEFDIILYRSDLNARRYVTTSVCNYPHYLSF